MTVSNNCGFANYEYSGLGLAAYYRLLTSETGEIQTEDISAIGAIGEWCRMGNHLYERMTFLKTRIWDGKRYVLDATNVHVQESDGALYLIDEPFIKKWNLSEYLLPIVDAGNHSSCLSSEKLAPYEQKERLNNGRKRFGHDICAVSGLFIRDIPGTHELVQP